MQKVIALALSLLFLGQQTAVYALPSHLTKRADTWTTTLESIAPTTLTMCIKDFNTLPAYESLNDAYTMFFDCVKHLPDVLFADNQDEFAKQKDQLILGLNAVGTSLTTVGVAELEDKIKWRQAVITANVAAFTVNVSAVKKVVESISGPYTRLKWMYSGVVNVVTGVKNAWNWLWSIPSWILGRSQEQDKAQVQEVTKITEKVGMERDQADVERNSFLQRLCKDWMVARKDTPAAAKPPPEPATK
jgi:hypothetical protein